MKKNETHVLIIGIDRYESPSLPALRGARNDAIAWYRFCVDHLGVEPKNIAVLASPPLSQHDLGPGSAHSRLRGASRAEIVEEARRLAADAGCNPGLMTFSGHGLALGADPGGAAAADLALCPSDTHVERSADDAAVGGMLRFAELSEIFGSQDCKDNITVVLDTCYSSGPTGPMRQAAPAGSAAQSAADSLDRARQILRVDAFTNRLFLGARHWTSAYEIKVGGQWRGAASYAMTTLMERWALREEDGLRFPNVSHADLLDAMRDFFDVLGVPQLPALWGKRRLDEMAVLRSGLRFSPGETSPRPNAATNLRQLPVNPDKVALITILDQNQNPIIHVVALGSSVPTGITGYNAGTEYWYTNTTSAPNPTSLTYSVTETTSQHAVDAFVSGWTLSIQCAQLIGTTNWSTWSSGTNSTGRLYRAADPSRNDTYMGLYLQWASNGTLSTYSWYRITLLTDGFAYTAGHPPTSFTGMTSTDPNGMQTATWKYSLVVSPP